MSELFVVYGLRSRKQLAIVAALHAPLLLVLILPAHVRVGLAHVPAEGLRLRVLASADWAHVALFTGLEVGTRLNCFLDLLSELLPAAPLFESLRPLGLGTRLALIVSVALSLLGGLRHAHGAAWLLVG